MNYELSLGVPAIAVGLSAISLLAPPLPNPVPVPIPVPVPQKKLAKDAAPIPNALAAAIKQMLLSNLVRTWYGACTEEVPTN